MPASPRVLLDATAVPADRGGVGRYVDALVPALLALGVDVVVVAQERDRAAFPDLPADRLVLAPAWAARVPARFAWEQLCLPRLARRVAADVVHSPHYTFPVLARRPVVVTLHDATFFTHPQVHSPLKQRFFRTWTRWALRWATRCVVPSAATGGELVRVAGGEPARLDVAHLGVDAAVFHAPDDDERAAFRAAVGVEGGYVAFLGTLEPRKNVPALIRGWVAAVGDRSDPPALVLAGAAGWDGDVAGEAERVPGHLRLLRTGYLPVGQLAALLGEAEVVAYPSLGEGFGLPVLEAMACGAPVLTTRLLSLPEVGGDAVAYTGVGDEEIARALGDLLDDPVHRADLGRRAQARAATFTWTACAAVHRDTYAASMGGRTR